MTVQYLMQIAQAISGQLIILDTLQVALLKSVILSVTVPLALRASCGPLPFAVAFAFTEYMKVWIELY